jgi:hypothetical protein
MRRRDFLFGSCAGMLPAFGFAGAPIPTAHSKLCQELPPAAVVILGGGLGGCAAALAASRAGERVILVEPTDWIGGQLTSQAVPPDEHPWIEQFGCNASYRQLRQGIRDYYRRHYPLNRAALDLPALDPGNGSVSALCHEPRVALAVLEAMVAPHRSAGRLTILAEHELIAAETEGDQVRAVTVRDRHTGMERILSGRFFLDATERGDLLPLAGVEHVVGAESQRETGEPHAPLESNPQDQQGITWCFALEYRPGEDHTINRPSSYPRWREYLPKLAPPWPGKLLSLTATHPVTLEPRHHEFDPTGAGAGLWVYRRILDPRNFQDGAYAGSTGVTLVNWPQNDFWEGAVVGVEPEIARNNEQEAKELSASLCYWLQTECPRPDGGTGWPGLRLRPDLMGTGDGFAKAPYIRESRRIKAEFTVLEQHVGTEARRRELGKEDVSAAFFSDSVGIGSYRIDLHPSCSGRNYVDISSLPFQIPLGALIPVRMENLLPACKNLGVTHITNGCYRLHPVEWAIGEAAGALAAFCSQRDATPRAVRNTPKLLGDFQSELGSQGVELEWPKLRPR